MYPLRPPKVFATETSLSDPLCHQRMARLLEGMGVRRETVAKVSDADLPEIIRAHGLVNSGKRGYQLPEDQHPIVFFNTLDLSDSDGKARTEAVLKQCEKGTPQTLVRRFLGYDYIGHSPGMIRSRELICRRSYEFQTTYGCLHRCKYC